MPEVGGCSLVGRSAEWLQSRQCLFESSGGTLALIIRNAKTPWEVDADPGGSDMVGEGQSYPLNFRQLDEEMLG
jgi:hypothetical protein